MATAIIIDQKQNESLLRFTETKLFFDANNQGTGFVDDCVVVDSYEAAMQLAEYDNKVIIINTGDFLTTNFRNKYKDATGVIVPTADDEIIKFDIDTYVGFNKRCKYKQGTKQLYIIENLLKTILRSKSLVYLDNTESATELELTADHLYGLASGWKTVELAQKIGLDNLKSITVYDNNPDQLSHAKWLHEQVMLPTEVPIYKHSCGEYNRPEHLIGFWKEWHNYPVKFELINLFDTPVFPKGSAIWISNVFQYEPTIFEFGWSKCKWAKQQLINSNKECIIFIK